MSSIPNFYAGSGLDRVSARRKDRDWVQSRLDTPGTRLLPVWRSRTLIADASTAPRAVWLDAAESWWRAEGAMEPALLGILDGIAHFVLDLSALEEAQSHPRLAPLGAFLDLRAVGPLLPPPEASLCAYARGLAWWHQRHRFCGVCGHATASHEAGHVRQCLDPACATQHFPRTDPAVIMLVHDGDRVLLGRTPRFMPGLYSVLAGFVEPGESLEEAVVREVFEESGIHVGKVRYHSSQPWPFPSSIMLGFTAEAASTAITLQADEMEDVAWFTRDRLRSLEDSGNVRLPRTDSIARHLIEDWLAGDI